jgi:CRP/FNR family transcriptional regulator, cyclic AMP receptor protein
VQALESRFSRTFQVGEVIFREGEAGLTMFVVRAGEVRISKHVRGGERTLATLGPGEFFGEMAVLSGRPRTATATALSELHLLELDEQRFGAMINSQAEIAARILKKLARRLDDADALIAILTRRDPKTRVILGLIREAEERGMPGEGNDSRVLQCDFNALSELLGVKRLEFDEVLARMTRVGVVRPVSGGLEVASVPRLNDFLAFLEQRGIVQD